MNLRPLVETHFPLFLVIVLRVAGILAAVPAIGARSVPMKVRIGLVIGISALLIPIVADRVRLPEFSLPSLLSVGFTEFLVGTAMGLCIRFVFVAFEIAGEVISLQMGLSIISVIDPLAGTQVPLLSNFMGMLASLIYFAIDGHHVVLEALVQSFQLVPPMEVHLSGAVGEAVLKKALGMFVLALTVASPVMTALFITTFAMGMLGRTLPQLNVMMSNVPVSIGVGLLALGLSLPLVGTVAQSSFLEIGSTLRGMLTLMGQAR
jgi:flagellar biosynthetic protein FliR